PKQFLVCLSLICHLLGHQAGPQTLLFSPQTATRACPPCIMHAWLLLRFPWDCHCQDKSSFFLPTMALHQSQCLEISFLSHFFLMEWTCLGAWTGRAAQGSLKDITTPEAIRLQGNCANSPTT
uniref:Uncharacterized protein n=1 Tax=Cyanoderma ruficeps TaxID=181631 RepID=A0A8C3RGQ8_9PASS